MIKNANHPLRLQVINFFASAGSCLQFEKNTIVSAECNKMRCACTLNLLLCRILLEPWETGISIPAFKWGHWSTSCPDPSQRGELIFKPSTMTIFTYSTLLSKGSPKWENSSTFKVVISLSGTWVLALAVISSLLCGPLCFSLVNIFEEPLKFSLVRCGSFFTVFPQSLPLFPSFTHGRHHKSIMSLF